jgi:hypothetical protein
MGLSKRKRKPKAKPATSKIKQPKAEEKDDAGLFRWLANAERAMLMKIGFRK